jgi:hypothetical protein
MRDCPNGEIRDLLPEFVHDRLAPAEAARVRDHVAACEDCDVEVALLRSLRGELNAPVVVNLSAITAGVVSRTTGAAAVVAAASANGVADGARGVTPIGSRWSQARWLRAAVLLVVVGGASAVTLQRFGGSGGSGGPGQPGMPRPTSALAPDGTTPAKELAFAGDVSDLQDTELQELEAAIAALEVQPMGDVETSADWGTGSTTAPSGGR